MEVFRYNILDKRIDMDISELKLNKFLPSHLVELIHTIPDDDYIIGVQYNEDDIQVGITGTGRYNEGWKNTLSRELFEEIKLIPNIKKIENVKRYENKRKQNWSCCKIHIQNTSTKNVYSWSQENNDNWRQKIGVLVYGGYQDIIEKLSFKNSLSSDNITHIVMLKCSFVKKYISHFRNVYNKNARFILIS
jgi:hypothetical protein